MGDGEQDPDSGGWVIAWLEMEAGKHPLGTFVWMLVAAAVLVYWVVALFAMSVLVCVRCRHAGDLGGACAWFGVAAGLFYFIYFRDWQRRRKSRIGLRDWKPSRVAAAAAEAVEAETPGTAERAIEYVRFVAAKVAPRRVLAIMLLFRAIALVERFAIVVLSAYAIAVLLGFA